MLSDEVKTRLDATIVELEGRVQGAADLTELIRQKALPQSPVAAFVVPAGQRSDGDGESASGAFTQAVTETVAVVLVLRAAGDVSGEKSLPTLEELVTDTIAVVAGWTPPDGASIYSVLGPFTFERGQLLQLNAGSLFYQLEFAAPIQLRILS